MTAKTGHGHWRTAHLLAAAGTAAAAATTAHASQPERVSLPYACRIEHGRPRLDPAPDQIYQLTGGRDQRAFTFCPERQTCQTVAVHRFTVSCGGQRVAWADIVAAVAERGHLKLAVVNGRLGLLARPRFAARAEALPPANRFLGGWCSDQFGGPSQPFLRQACNEARRLASNLGGPPQPQPPSPHFIALPKGFAPLADVGARLLPPAQAPASLTAAQISQAAIPTASEPAIPSPLSTPEPNGRTAEAPQPRPPVPQSAMTAETASAWITSVHLASATVAASSEAAAERHRASSGQSAAFMMILAGILAGAALVAAAARRTRPAQLVPAAAPGDARTLARLSAPDGSVAFNPAQQSAVAWPTAAGLLRRRVRHRLAGLHGHVRTALARTANRSLGAVLPRAPLSAAQLAAVAALPVEARLIMTAREQAADRIDHLRQAIAPLARTAPSLQAALARDLMAGDRRLAKITIASLAADTENHDAVGKRAQSRLHRVAADLDRLQEIIAGAIASLTREAGPRQLPRDLPEAYAALGVGVGVPDATLKKLVDALRVCWHPDLAASEEDRHHRDERIKEINVAWDLIAGKRTAE